MELTRLLQEVRAINEGRDEKLIARIRIERPLRIRQNNIHNARRESKMEVLFPLVRVKFQIYF